MNPFATAFAAKAAPPASAFRRIMKDAVDSFDRARRLHEEMHAIDPEAVSTLLASETTVIDSEIHLLRCVLASGTVVPLAGLGKNFCRKSRAKGVIFDGILYVAVPNDEGECLAEGELSSGGLHVMTLHRVDLGDVVDLNA